MSLRQKLKKIGAQIEYYEGRRRAEIRYQGFTWYLIRKKSGYSIVYPDIIPFCRRRGMVTERELKKLFPYRKVVRAAEVPEAIIASYKVASDLLRQLEEE